MKANEPNKPPSPKPASGGPSPNRAEGEATEEERSESQGKGMKYVFKIAPADPKNTLNFEDVADK